MEDKKTTKAKFNQVSAEIEKRIHEGIYCKLTKITFLNMTWRRSLIVAA